jgi:hypothetical protein
MGQYRGRKLLVGISKNEIHVRHCNNSGHFMKRYYNPVVLCHDERRIPYRDVTNVQDFVNYAKRNLSFELSRFIAKRTTRTSKNITANSIHCAVAFCFTDHYEKSLFAN